MSRWSWIILLVIAVAIVTGMTFMLTRQAPTELDGQTGTGDPDLTAPSSPEAATPEDP